ncbi:Hypp115 [Branchiostoma lanceolatum]|uniref:Hypp115 protein n=1 Tax=Branchiostoma lanceolatum TaxID=7740 RepID=A0A8J9VX71_BRALA|nr:Hypp115 [Branchiostoma lanceolatum]
MTVTAGWQSTCNPLGFGRDETQQSLTPCSGGKTAESNDGPPMRQNLCSDDDEEDNGEGRDASEPSCCVSKEVRALGLPNGSVASKEGSESTDEPYWVSKVD